MSTILPGQIEIRAVRESDLESILQVFKDSVWNISYEDYSREQLDAWASAAHDIQRWKDKIKLQYFIVAYVNGKLVGFGALENNDLIDLLYVHKNFQGSGVGTGILENLISIARSKGSNVLKAVVSKTARRFFEARGFAIAQEQSIQIKGIALINYQMMKRFHSINTHLERLNEER